MCQRRGVYFLLSEKVTFQMIFYQCVENLSFGRAEIWIWTGLFEDSVAQRLKGALLKPTLKKKKWVCNPISNRISRMSQKITFDMLVQESLWIIVWSKNSEKYTPLWTVAVQ